MADQIMALWPKIKENMDLADKTVNTAIINGPWGNGNFSVLLIV